jgi:hypothetical protein
MMAPTHETGCLYLNTANATRPLPGMLEALPE